MDYIINTLIYFTSDNFPFFSLNLFVYTQERSSGSVLGNYESYKPPSGAMGDRMAAMKQAFQVTSMHSNLSPLGFWLGEASTAKHLNVIKIMKVIWSFVVTGYLSTLLIALV